MRTTQFRVLGVLATALILMISVVGRSADAQNKMLLDQGSSGAGSTQRTIAGKPSPIPDEPYPWPEKALPKAMTSDEAINDKLSEILGPDKLNKPVKLPDEPKF